MEEIHRHRPQSRAEQKKKHCFRRKDRWESPSIDSTRLNAHPILTGHQFCYARYTFDDRLCVDFLCAERVKNIFLDETRQIFLIFRVVCSCSYSCSVCVMIRPCLLYITLKYNQDDKKRCTDGAKTKTTIESTQVRYLFYVIRLCFFFRPQT